MLNCQACRSVYGMQQVTEFKKVLNASSEPRHPAAVRLRYRLIAAIREREQALRLRRIQPDSPAFLTGFCREGPQGRAGARRATVRARRRT